MGKKIGVSQQLVNYYLHQTLDLKTVHKPKGHHLSQAMREKRRARSWPLYLRLNLEKWKNFITSDEALFTLDGSSGKTEIQYLKKDTPRHEAAVREVKRNSKSVMVWVAMGVNGLSKPRFIPPNCKINADNYINLILKPFLKEDIKKLCPERNFVFHQDSAPSHAAKKTIEFLRSREINFITPDEWLPNSPDCSPCDYFLWGYLKSKLKKVIATNLKELQNAIRRELRKVPIKMIEDAMRAWPGRCRAIYYSNGGHIEKFKRKSDAQQ